LALLTAAFLWPGATIGSVSQSGELSMSASAEITPIGLPRSKPAPASLQLGFSSEALDSTAIPGLAKVVFEISRNLDFEAAGLPSCPLADLYSTYLNARQTCAGSVVGQGRVISEVTPPGQAPTTIDGHLIAFYALAQGTPRILAQVTSGDPLPLTYVIPFEVAKAHGAFGTSLIARQMRKVAGVCGRGHPNCFAQPYALEGVYGHISNFEMSLHRTFVHAGRRDSFVSARCPALGKRREATFALTQTSLHYAGGGSLTATANGRCRVSIE
jgi:hypothetical protein